MNYIILTEGGQECGLGHIYRCISFYDELCSRGYNITMIISGDDTVYGAIEKRNFILIDWTNNVNVLDSYLKNDTWLFLDSIQATQSDIDYISRKVRKFVVIDDFKRRFYNNAVIIDWTANVEKTNKHIHNVGNGNTLLLGLKYSILRKAFLSKSSYNCSPIQKILITMGGTDIRCLTLPLLEYLILYFPELEFRVITTPNFNEFKKNIDHKNIFFLEKLDDYEMKEAMESSNLVITAGGQTLYELASIGVPTIAIQVVDNQYEDLEGLFSLGFLVDFFQWNDIELFEKIKNKIFFLMTMFTTGEFINKTIKNEIGEGLTRIIDIIE